MIIFNTREDTNKLSPAKQMVLWISRKRYGSATTVSHYKYVSIPQPEPDQFLSPVGAIHTKAA